jgi:sugar (pentulose or hexulose) kinase
MEKQYIMGIDFGTTGTKAVIYDPAAIRSARRIWRLPWFTPARAGFPRTRRRSWTKPFLP